MRILSSCAVPLAGFLSTMVGLSAQTTCTTGWAPGAIPGTSGTVNACVWWDPDGAGPRAQILVVGGDFQFAGDQAAERIAAYDPQTGSWSTFGSGMNQFVTSLAVLANGDLVAGGSFSTAGGQPRSCIARWDGAAWQPFGSGCNSVVHALAARPNGNLVASGLFTSAGGIPVNYIAEWDGSTWGAMNGGVDYTQALGSVAPAGVLLTMPNGDVVAGGRFSTAGGVAASCIARWNGTIWAPVGTGIPQLGFAWPWNPVMALTRLPNGDLVAGGAFTQAGGVPANAVARWNGTTWSPMGTGLSGTVHALTTLPNGQVQAGGRFSPFNEVRQWNGNSWLPSAYVGSSFATTVYSLATSANGAVAAGGYFTALGNNLAVQTAGLWAPPNAGAASPGAGFAGQVFAATYLQQDLLVGGQFQQAGGGFANSLARWNGAVWSDFGTGLQGLLPSPPVVDALVTRANGEVVAGGYFSGAGNHLARWNGSSWSGLGGGTDAAVDALLETAAGDLVVGGWFTTPAARIARWNGTSWSSFGSGFDNGVQALLELPNGDLIAGGAFTTAGGASASRIARWNGAAWQALGSGVDGDVHALALLRDGSVVAACRFSNAGGVAALRVARWDGLAWSAMGAGINTYAVRTLQVLPDGNLLAGGDSVVSRWDGASWTPVSGAVYGRVYAFAAAPWGGLVATGDFTLANNSASHVAHLVSSCPATGQPYGAGCAGAGGLDTLVVDRLPWAGSTFRAAATGLPSQGIAFGVVGLTPASTPLSALVPQGLPGCTALLAPLSIELLVAANGRATTGFGIPNAPYVVGVQILTQVLALETDQVGGLLAVTSSNGLQLGIGAF